MRLKYIDYGTGNRVGNTIYLNKDLKKYPKLHNAILKHEKKHSGGVKAYDFKLDLFNHELKRYKKDFYKFVITHPKSWVNFLPVMRIEGTWYWDISLSILWGIIVFEAYIIYLVLSVL